MVMTSLARMRGMLSARQVAERLEIPYKKFLILRKRDLAEKTPGKRVPDGRRRLGECKNIMIDYDPNEVDEWARAKIESL